MDTNSRTNLDEFSLMKTRERRMGKTFLRMTNTAYPSHVYRNTRKPAEASQVLSSYDKAFLPIFLPPNHGHMEGIQTQHTLCKRHSVPTDLILASRFAECQSNLQQLTHVSTYFSIPSTDQTTCQTNAFEMFE